MKGIVKLSCLKHVIFSILGFSETLSNDLYYFFGGGRGRGEGG